MGGEVKRRTSSAIRFAPELHERLLAEAEARDLSVNWLVNRLLTEALARLRSADEFRLTDPA